MKSPREALRQWWLARLQPVHQWTLQQRTIYIVPTRAGLAFALTLVLLLLASINFQLNLGYALTFLLAGSALVSMHMTHGSLRGLTLHTRVGPAVFAGDALPIEVVITNPGRTRHGLGLGVQADLGESAWVWCEVPAQCQTPVMLSTVAPKRGLMKLPRLRIETRFPFGLFQAWSVWQPAGEVWVYPRPEFPATELPPAEALPATGTASTPSNSGEFDGVRPWRQGDGLRQVVWKKVASSGQLISRDARQSHRQMLWLDWRQTPPMDPELRLSRLAAWVMQADARGLRFGLRLPNRELSCGDGKAHREAALQCLAQW
jgi:uncharacterized protein (DUF58 family)